MKIYTDAGQLPLVGVVSRLPSTATSHILRVGHFPYMHTQPNSGEILVYRFLPATYALQAIETGELKVGRISELNDPFEFNPASSAGFFRGMPVAEYLKELIKGLDDEVGLLCFSHAPHDAVVWSHYSQSHRGIALGFEFALDDKLFKVDYPADEHRPVFDPIKYEEDLKAEEPVSLRALYGIKAHSWSYEREYRKLIDLRKCAPHGGMYFYPLDKADLKVVVLGSRSTISEKYVADALKGARVPAVVKKANLHPTKFEVTF